MSYRIRALTTLLCLAAATLAGCKKKEMLPLIGEPKADKNYEAQLPPGELALRKITDPRLIPDFTAAAAADRASLLASIDRSLAWLAKPSSNSAYPYGQITHDQSVASLKAFAQLLNSPLTPEALNSTIREKFDVYVSVGYADNMVVFYTGYYTPIFDASLTRTEKFRYPLYRKPPGLVKKPDGTPTVAMPDRRTIESKRLYDGNELVWLSDPFESYICHVQGSARLHLTDGLMMTVGYAANNGHVYKSIRPALEADGKIEKRAGLAAMIAYFKAHPAEVYQYTWTNPRFVFFEVVPDGRPRGSLNEPVTPWRTIATDKTIYPPGCLAFVSADLPQRGGGGEVVTAPFTGFVLDQDTGGAIRAPGRCDIYMGIGANAGQLAGHTRTEGRLYYLFLKPAAAPGQILQPAPPPESLVQP
ncbi:MAG: hypothetical protein BIFFINMI_03435 [Phycisphaerae bacterium]|nr:hypothetical protein [Phycisphaerae bacterium]